MQRKYIIATIIGGIALVAVAAGASALVTKQMSEGDKPVITEAKKSAPPARKEEITWNEPAAPQPAQPQQAAVNCDDGNVVGHVIGGAAGGLIGSQIGSGSGQTAATIGGTLGGAYLGGQHIPTRNVTCP